MCYSAPTCFFSHLINNTCTWGAMHLYVRRRYSLRTRGQLKFVNPRAASGEKCLRCYLPNFVNNSSPQILDKINTHSNEGFSFLIKRTKLNSYCIECTVPNCCICSNCHWINPALISRFYFVICYVFQGYPVQELFLWFDYLYAISIFMSLIVFVFRLSLLCFFEINFLC